MPLGLRRAWLRSLARRTVERLRERFGHPIPRDAEMAILFLSVREMTSLNAHHRSKDAVTDVLSFPQEPPGRHGPHLGDVVICPVVARSNARRAGRSYRSEVAVLTIHGLLHLLGYDHETDQGEMRMRERELWRLLRLGRLGDEDLL